MKIAILISELQMGGAAKVVRDHAAAFRAFAEVREIVFNCEDGVDFDGAPVVSLDVGGGGNPLNRLANFARRVVRFRRFKHRWQPDVSIAHLEGAHYVDALSRNGDKSVLVVHGSIDHNRDIAGLKGWVRRQLLMPFAFRKADAIVAVSREIAAEVAASGFPNVRVINNFFDPDRIAAQAGEPLTVGQAALFGVAPVIVSLGRLAPEKNLDALLQAFSLLLTRRHARLLLIGDGPSRDMLIETAGALGLSVSSPWTGSNSSADVHFVGVQTNPFSLMARSTLFAMPSRWEGFPLALCEAMACGLPIIASDCPTGPREILSPESVVPKDPIRCAEAAPFGMLMPIPWRNAPALGGWANTIDDLLDNETTRATLASAGEGRVRDFSADRIVGKWRALFEELLA